ncbi:Protein NRT1/PTR FAMILY 7.3 [Abeliophyllum distichum]|uniref:Protein NRT1/PTR FAMILY 7.3 n=1 Tax=Abeliophyllum distichum TaxID=126358 RepID=A0ABD1TZC3_9LAMI
MASLQVSKEKLKGEVEQECCTGDGTVDHHGRPAIREQTGKWVAGIVILLATQLFLLKPRGCGDETTQCRTQSSWELSLFYVSIYMIALGNGGYQPNIATFGADQFDEEDAHEGHSKVAFFSYFYLALNLGSLFSNTILGYFEDEGIWVLGFWASTGSAFAALILFLGGTKRYRHFKPRGNPLSRFFQVIVAACKELESENAIFEYNPWRLCPIAQVEEVKCILRLLPIWLCTIIYSVVFTQMASLFVEQGDAMKTTISNFRIPSASMSSFDILSVAVFIFLYRRVIDPTCQLEFFNAKAPDGLKSFGSALCMTSISLGNYVSSLLVSIVMKFSTVDNLPGWIPGNLNRGHLDRFYFLLGWLDNNQFGSLYCVCQVVQEYEAWKR